MSHDFTQEASIDLTVNSTSSSALRKRHSYLSSYSPELNLIEILWQRIKYSWLPFSAYECLNALIEALENILRDVGSEYQITFA
jgi:transposase